MNEADLESTKARLPWFQFRLRTLLIVTALLSLPLAWVSAERQQRASEAMAVAWVHDLNGQVEFHGDPLAGVCNWGAEEPEPPAWHDHYSGKRVKGVVILGLTSTHDHGLVFFRGKPVTDLSPLAKCQDIEYLTIYGTLTSDLSSLSGLVRLKELNVSSEHVTDISPILALHRLESLTLYCPQATNVLELARLTNLKRLDLPATHLSDDQLQELRRALPRCGVNGLSWDRRRPYYAE